MSDCYFKHWIIILLSGVLKAYKPCSHFYQILPNTAKQVVYMGTAITPLVAESDGKKDINQGRNIFLNGIVLCFIIGFF